MAWAAARLRRRASWAGAGDGRVRAVGRHEVDQRLGVLEVLAVVDPARVRSDLAVLLRVVELPPQIVQRRDAGLTGPRHVDRRQVERETEQVVAQGLGDELVELVADLVGRAEEDAARRLLRRVGSGICRVVAVEVLRWVEEPLEQREAVVTLGATRGGLVDASDLVVEHRVPEPVHGVGELGRDRRVDVRVVAEEGLDRRLDLAGELLEDEVLVLHLGHEASRLEEPLAVPAVGVLRRGQLPLGEPGLRPRRASRGPSGSPRRRAGRP